MQATAAADPTVVVGDEVETSRPVVLAHEEPAYGGPVAGLMAGRQALDRAPDLLPDIASTWLQLRGKGDGPSGWNSIGRTCRCCFKAPS